MSVRALQVLVLGRPVATLSTEDGFNYALTYRPGVDESDFVSLTMPVRPASWTWPALHPFFQMNLPEGFLLSVLRERLGPLLGASPLDLLAVVGGNMIGRVNLVPFPSGAIGAMSLDAAPIGGSPPAPPIPVETAALNVETLAGLLHGERSIDRFLELVSVHAASGVSGVVPKFLAPELAAGFRKASLRTERHILKGSSEHAPFLALNEHLCLQVAAHAGLPAARSQVSEDGQVLEVERFDIAGDATRLGFEDVCSLLGLSPDRKYDSSWERAARCVLDFVAPEHSQAAAEQLAAHVLLNFALGNADCHTKNLGLLYSNRQDVRLSPVYDLLSIRIYDRYVDNAPGMFLGGRKAWTPGKELPHFLQGVLGIDPPAQRRLVDGIASALSDVMPALLRHHRDTPGFTPWAAHMAHEWNIGLQRIAWISKQVPPDLAGIARTGGLEPVAARAVPAKRTGESELLGRRGRKRPAS